MKIDFSIDDIKNEIVAKRKLLYVLFGLLVLGVISYAVYSVVIINDDQEVVAESNNATQQLNITFDKKFLQDLKNKQTAGTLNETSGRNPFLLY